MTDPKDIAAKERAQAAAEKAEAALARAEADRLEARAAEDLANADALDPPAPPPGPAAAPPSAPQPAPAPSGTPPAAPAPTLVDFDPTTATRIGAENDTVGPLAKGGLVTYGAPGGWTQKQFNAGDTVPLTNAVFGDPLFGTVKAGYVRDVTMLPAKQPPAAPAPTGPTTGPVNPVPVTDPAGSVSRATMEAVSGLCYGPDTVDVSGMQVYDPASGSPGNLRPHEGETGASDELATVTGDSARAIISNDPKAWDSVISTALCVDNWPFRITDRTTGDMPAKPWLNVKQSFQDNSSNLTWDTRPNPYGLQADGQHQPHPIYVPALYCLLLGTADSLAKFQVLVRLLRTMVAYNYFNVPPQSRGPNGGNASRADAGDLWMDGVFDPEPSANDQRGSAWKVAAVAQLFHLECLAKKRGVSIEGDPNWYAWTKTAVQSNIHFYLYRYKRGTMNAGWADPYYSGPYQGNALGIMTKDEGAYGQGRNGDLLLIGAFQQAFQCGVVGWMADLADFDLDAQFKDELAELAVWALGWSVMLAGDRADPRSWPFNYFGEYAIAVAKRNNDGTFTYARDGGELFEWNYLNAGIPRPTDDRIYYHDGTDPAPGLGDGFFSDGWQGLVKAVDLKLPGARAAIQRMYGSDQFQKAGGPDIAPQFAFSERNVRFSKLPPKQPDVQPVEQPAPAPAQPGPPVANPPAATPPAAPPPAWRGDKNSVVSIPATNTAQSEVLRLLPPDGQGTWAADVTRVYGGGALVKDWPFPGARGMALRSSGHATMQQMGFAAVFDPTFSALTWRGFGAPNKGHPDQGARMSQDPADYMYNFYVGDDGKPDGATSGHAYWCLQVQDVSEGGGPHLIQFGTSGGCRVFSGYRIDMTKDGRDAYDLKPFPTDGLRYDGYGYPMTSVKLPGLGIIYSAQWGRNGGDVFIPFDPSKFGGRTQIAVPPIMFGVTGSGLVFVHPTKLIVISVYGGTLDRWGPPNSSANETPKVQFIDFTAGIDNPKVSVVGVDNYAILSTSTDGQHFDIGHCGMSPMVKYGRVVGVNIVNGRGFSVRPGDPNDWLAKNWIAEEDVPPQPFFTPQSGASYSYYNRMVDLSDTPLDGVMLIADTETPAQLWRPSFVAS